MWGQVTVHNTAESGHEPNSWAKRPHCLGSKSKEASQSRQMGSPQMQ